jgi:cephalosporin-C deacetylase-like acetyl esterase
VAKLSSAAEVEARRRHVRERMLAALGGLPERTPLNAKVVGSIEGDDYRIEKIVFESQPKFFVTANLYLPKRGQPPYPAVLYPLGHESGSKAHATWQQMLVSLAKKGYVALAWDPIGQGERVQLYDEDFSGSKAVRSTTEHTIIGAQCLLTGQNLARYTIWDGMRALDYLLSRKEVDAKRVACTGNSGGGTHTAYLSALDDRIQVAAPSCYITSWRRLLHTIGPQDAEQCLPPWIADGLDHPDFIYGMAPKPYLILSAIRDFFSIQGARESYEEARKVYAAIGAEDKIRMVEADDGHGYSKPRRMAAYDWFARWLKGSEDSGPEPQVQIRAEEDLWCTAGGQVATSLGGETVFTMNRARAAQLRSKRRKPSAEEVRAKIAFGNPGGDLKARSYGVIDRDAYRIERLTYQSEPGIIVPSLLFVPKGASGKTQSAIYVDGRGKAAAQADIEDLVKRGLVVLAIDARGFGETRRMSRENGSDWPRYFGDYDSAMTGLLIGKPLVGLRALDIVRGLDVLSARPEVDGSRLAGFGRDAGGIPLLHAAALDARIKKVAIEGSLVSFESMVNRRMHRGMFEHVIRGVLESYDLPELAASLAPRPVWVVDAADPMGQPLTAAQAEREYAGAKAAPVRVLRRQPEQSSGDLYGELIAR